MWAKKWGHRLVTIILSILNRFKKFYQQERDWRLANTPLKDVLACNFAKYSPILKFFLLTDSEINLS